MFNYVQKVVGALLCTCQYSFSFLRIKAIPSLIFNSVESGLGMVVSSYVLYLKKLLNGRVRVYSALLFIL